MTAAIMQKPQKSPRQPTKTFVLVLVFVFVSLGTATRIATITTNTGPRRAQSTQSASSKKVHQPIAKPYTFPDGGRQLFPQYRLVGLYGTPAMPVLGALGQQPLPAAITRVKKVAAAYQPYTTQKILPTFEIITTVASAGPTANHDYSQEIEPSSLLPWILAAQKAGIYVVLDLQSGRSSFVGQAKEYANLLKQPNVGLALDPEWRLEPEQVPLVQIGSVNIQEVNQTADWLANLTEQNHLPQKLFLLHEFRLSMLPDRQALDTSHNQLAYAVQMDGQGTQDVKLDTWHAILADPPPNVHFGWKNFYAKDQPTRSPAATMALTPQPWYVSYQ